MSVNDADGSPSVRWWWLAVALFTVSLGYVLYFYIGTVMLGLFVYYAARPFARRLESVTDSRSLSAAAAVLFVALPFVVVFSAILLAAIAELASLRPETLAAMLRYLFPDADLTALGTLPTDPVAFLSSLLKTIGLDTVQSLLGEVLSVASVFLNALFQVVLALLLAFYLLRDDRTLAGWFEREFAADDSPLHRYATAVDRDLSIVFYGVVVTIFVVIVLSGVMYLGLNLIAPPGLSIPDPVLLAVVTGIATLVPMIGRASVYLVVAGWMAVGALTTTTTALWFPALFLVVMILVVDQVVNFGVQPYLSGQTIHSGLMLFALGVGTALFGWYGTIFGPFLLVVNFEFVRLVLPSFVRGESLVIRTETGAQSTAGAAVDEGVLFDDS